MPFPITIPTPLKSIFFNFLKTNFTLVIQFAGIGAQKFTPSEMVLGFLADLPIYFRKNTGLTDGMGDIHQKSNVSTVTQQPMLYCCMLYLQLPAL